jgi:cyclic-di-GMP-binding biofilm dispersal mediator protein
MAAYCASKAGLAAAAAALSAEVRRDGVQVIDLRPPHTETGLSGRPLAGEAPKMPRGLDPDDAATRMVQAIIDGERVVRPTEFGRA